MVGNTLKHLVGNQIQGVYSKNFSSLGYMRLINDSLCHTTKIVSCIGHLELNLIMFNSMSAINLQSFVKIKHIFKNINKKI